MRVDVGFDLEDGLLRQMDRADAEVERGVEDALGGERDGRAEQVAGPLAGQGGAPLQAGAGRREDVARDGVHRRGRAEMPGGGDPVEVPHVERDEAAGGVEDVDDGGLLRVGVPGGGGEDDAQAVVAGERVEPGGVAEAGRGAFGSAVADDLDGERVARQQGAPPGQRGLGLTASPVQHGPADVGVGTEEDDERAGTIRARGPRLPGRGGQLGDELRRGDRFAALAAEMSGGDQPAEPPPPGARVETGAHATSEHGDAWPSGVDDRPAPHRSTGARATRTTLVTRTALAGAVR